VENSDIYDVDEELLYFRKDPTMKRKRMHFDEEYWH